MSSLRLWFRPIRIPDEVTLAARHRCDSFRISFGREDMFDEVKYARWLGAFSARLPEAVVFALCEDEVVGQIEAHVREGGVGYVNLFYLAPGFRGRGLGEQLHAYIVGVLEEQGVSCIELAVSPTNAQALRFYEKHGYRRLGLRAHAEPPVLEMRLELELFARRGAAS